MIIRYLLKRIWSTQKYWAGGGREGRGTIGTILNTFCNFVAALCVMTLHTLCVVCKAKNYTAPVHVLIKYQLILYAPCVLHVFDLCDFKNNPLVPLIPKFDLQVGIFGV